MRNQQPRQQPVQGQGHLKAIISDISSYLSEKVRSRLTAVLTNGNTRLPAPKEAFRGFQTNWGI